MMSQLLTVIFVTDSYIHVLHTSESDTHTFKATVYTDMFIELFQSQMSRSHDVHDMFKLKEYLIS